MRSLAEQTTREHGILVTVNAAVESLPVETSAAHEILMAVREAVYNAVQHSGSKRIEMSAARTHDELTIRIADFGSGFNFETAASAAHGHFGLLGMRERMNRIGGRFEIHSEPRRGTTITLWIRLAREIHPPLAVRNTEGETDEFPPEPIGILIVDDHPLMRVGIAAILNGQPGFRVVGQAGSAEEAVRLFRELNPDITLMDLRLPDRNGVYAIRQIRAASPQARIIVLTTYEGDEDIHQALEAGAHGYLIKGMSHTTLIQALKRVHAGQRVSSPRHHRAAFPFAPLAHTSASASRRFFNSSSQAKATAKSAEQTRHQGSYRQVACQRHPHAAQRRGPARKP